MCLSLHGVCGHEEAGICFTHPGSLSEVHGGSAPAEPCVLRLGRSRSPKETQAADARRKMNVHWPGGSGSVRAWGGGECGAKGGGYTCHQGPAGVTRKEDLPLRPPCLEASRRPRDEEWQVEPVWTPTTHVTPLGRQGEPHCPRPHPAKGLHHDWPRGTRMELWPGPGSRPCARSCRTAPRGGDRDHHASTPEQGPCKQVLQSATSGSCPGPALGPRSVSATIFLCTNPHFFH